MFQICEVVAGNAQLPTVDSQHSAQKKVSSATELLCHQNTNEQWTLSSSNSSAVVYGLGHHSSRSRGKCIVSSVSRDIASLLLISPEIGYFSCAQMNNVCYIQCGCLQKSTTHLLYNFSNKSHALYFMIYVR